MLQNGYIHVEIQQKQNVMKRMLYTSCIIRKASKEKTYRFASLGTNGKSSSDTNKIK